MYIDSSSFLKLFFKEKESPAVRKEIHTQPEVAVSTLTEFESRVQIQAAYLGGEFTEKTYHSYLRQLEEFKDTDPFHFYKLSGTIFESGMRQVETNHEIYLRSMDRLHLAAMEELGLKGLITNDHKQAIAAREMGFEVTVP